MSMPDMEIDANITPLYSDIKLRGTQKYALFKIERKRKIVVDQLGDPCRTEDKEADKVCFDQLAALLTKEPRYILYDFGFTSKKGKRVARTAFIFWCPDNARIGDKMIYGTNKDIIMGACPGLSLHFQANNPGDMNYTEISNIVEMKSDN